MYRGRKGGWDDQTIQIKSPSNAFRVGCHARENSPPRTPRDAYAHTRTARNAHTCSSPHVTRVKHTVKHPRTRESPTRNQIHLERAAIDRFETTCRDPRARALVVLVLALHEHARAHVKVYARVCMSSRRVRSPPRARRPLRSRRRPSVARATSNSRHRRTPSSIGVADRPNARSIDRPIDRSTDRSRPGKGPPLPNRRRARAQSR